MISRATNWLNDQDSRYIFLLLVVSSFAVI